MPATYEPISSTTLASASAEVNFTGIPQTFSDLVLIGNVANSGSGSTSAVIRLQVGNGSFDTGSNYSTTFLVGEISTVSGVRVTNQTFGYNGECLGTLANASPLTIYFNNYSNTVTNKTFLTRHGSTSRVEANVTLWRSTSAINQIKVHISGNTFIAGSTFTLYGIRGS